MKLSQKIVAKLLAEGTGDGQSRKNLKVTDADCPGLALRIQDGAATWIVRFTPAGTFDRRQVTLGSVAALPLAKAREEAGALTRAARHGEDPAAERREQAAAARARREAEARRREAESGRALAVIVEAYLRHAATALRASTVREATRYLKKHWLPLHGQVADELDRRTIVARLEAIAANNGPTAANRARSYLSMACAWAVARGRLDRNPVVGVKPLSAERSRERVLPDPELAALWRAAEADGTDAGKIVLLLLLTGQRREEVGGMTWQELELERGTWSLPAERTKNHRPHVVPLAPAAVAILTQVERKEERPHVFGRNEKSGFAAYAQAKARIDARIAAAGDMLAPWVLHDIRRSVVTGMVELGIAPHVVEAIVNHVSGHRAGVAGVYNRATYATEKRAALERWADHLERLVTGRAAKVVRLRPPA